MYGLQCNNRNRDLSLDCGVLGERNIAIVGQLTRNAQLRTVERADDGGLITNFECDIDIVEANGKNLITSSVGVFAESIEGFVSNYLRYSKPIKACIANGIGWIVTSDSFRCDNESESIYDPQQFRYTLPTTWRGVAKRYNFDCVTKQFIDIPDTMNEMEYIYELIKEGELPQSDVVSTLRHMGRSYLIERIERPLIWDEAVNRKDVKEVFGLPTLRYSDIYTAPCWVEANEEYFEIHTRVY